jgi:glutamate/tyrosine decarboxylase-like PLP-dependent enzyme
MYPQLQNDNKSIADLLEQVTKNAIAHLNNIDDKITATSSQQTNNALPPNGVGAQAALQQFMEQYHPLMVASSGPRYFGFVTGGVTPAALTGDWLTPVYDQNTQGTNGPGDVSAIVELSTIKMMLELFGLPLENFNGGFVSGATMSNFTCLAVARQWGGKQENIDVAREGMKKSNTQFITATPHSSAVKSLSMLGIGSSNIISLKVLPDGEAVDIEDLKIQLDKLSGQPIVFISSAGTVNTVDFDDMQAIAELKKQYNFWWHIDAAFGGFAACSPQYKHLLHGWEAADSITIDCHKWMNVPYDSAVFFTRKEYALLQTQVFQNGNAPYLGDPFERFSYLNFLPENSRRFRALPAWFTLIAYGKEGYRQIVENNIALAYDLGKRIQLSEKFILAAPVRLNTVCFTIKDHEQDTAYIQQFVKKLNERAKVFMTPTVYKGNFCLRAALVNWRTTNEDIDIAWNELNETYETQEI